MKKAFFAASILMLLASIILLKEFNFFTKDNFMLTRRSENVTAKGAKTAIYSADNTDVEILDKTQLLLMNIH